MDSNSTVGTVPHPVTEGVGVLDAVDEDFMNVYDVPFIIVNRVDGRLVAEVELSDNDLVNMDRIQEAVEVGRREGEHVFASKNGDISYPTLAGLSHGWLEIIFTPDTDGGL